jgi:hypothetical protein
LSTNPGGLSARMVTEGSPSLFAHAATQPFQALEGVPYPRFLFRGHTAAHRGENGAFVLRQLGTIFLLLPIHRPISADLP